MIPDEKQIYDYLFLGLEKTAFVHPKAKDLILERAKIVEFQEKEIVLRKGKVCKDCYFVVSGTLRAYFEKGRKVVTAWFMVSGDVAIGISSFYYQEPSKEVIVAMEYTICVKLSYEDLQFIYQECVEFNITGRLLTEKYHTIFAVRLSTIVDSPKERYEKFMEEYPQLANIGQEIIASYLGISRATLTRVRREFQKQKSVK